MVTQNLTQNFGIPNLLKSVAEFFLVILCLKSLLTNEYHHAARQPDVWRLPRHSCYSVNVFEAILWQISIQNKDCSFRNFHIPHTSCKGCGGQTLGCWVNHATVKTSLLGQLVWVHLVQCEDIQEEGSSFKCTDADGRFQLYFSFFFFLPLDLKCVWNAQGMKVDSVMIPAPWGRFLG